MVERGRPQMITYANCMLDKQDYRHILRIYNTYSFFTATMVARWRLNVLLLLLILLLFCRAPGS